MLLLRCVFAAAVVTFSDGAVIWHNSTINTFVEALRHIGLECVPQVGIKHPGYDLVGKVKRPIEAGHIWQHE